MTFLSPWFLLLLVPLAGLAVAAVVIHQRRGRIAARFAAPGMLGRLMPERPGWRRPATGGLGLLALVLLVTAAARPEADIRVQREQATVMIAIDVSGSMRATDVAPSRLEAAIEAGEQFVDQLPERFRIGLISFEGYTTVLATPTTDHEAVKNALSGLRLGVSTAVGEGVFASLEQVRDLDARLTPADPEEPEAEPIPARIVLLSDGTSVTGRSPEAAAAAAAEAGVPVSTIAYGTPEGVVDEGTPQERRVPADAETLARLAESTGGTAYQAESSDQLREVYEDIGSSIAWTTEPRELAPYFSAAAFVIALIAAALSLRWFARLI
ncbi:VWA domain-containing protein [Kineosporia babensis]|uniref:VWA domain-containing protein n=1 Tax=Kineosporia babensis TaxID=499548 RepID=A0A9X1NLT5_9ACTN|nr:VWA domain-containing protein [Kineosporia babensis]MCD5316081.1 VWA domain-containing protein [Kineosporia babensis]